MNAQLAALISQSNTDITVEQPQRAVITPNHHRTPRIPAPRSSWLTLDQTGALQSRFNPLIQPGNTEWPLS
ncbi:hypothetical protein D3C72_2176990 [compost metagenome]